jgi:hypothetical protein
MIESFTILKIFFIVRNGFGGGDRNNEEHDGQRTQGFNSNRGSEFLAILFLLFDFNRCL